MRILVSKFSVAQGIFPHFEIQFLVLIQIFGLNSGGVIYFFIDVA